MRPRNARFSLFLIFVRGSISVLIYFSEVYSKSKNNVRFVQVSPRAVVCYFLFVDS